MATRAKKKKINLLTSSELAKSKKLSESRLVNMYLVSDTTNPTYNLCAYSFWGLKSWLDFSVEAPIRALYRQANILYAVVEKKVYKVTPLKAYTQIGTLDTAEGHVQIVSTNNEILFKEPGAGWVYDIAELTFSRIESTYVDSEDETVENLFQNDSDTVSQLDSYGFCHVGKQCYFSSLDNLAEWPALNFFSKEQYPDSIAAVQSFQQYIVLIGTQTTEPWYNTGDDDPFAPVSGVTLKYGTNASRSVATSSNKLLWLARGQQGKLTIIAVNEAWEVIELADKALCYVLEQYETEFGTNDAEAFCFEKEGKEFYQINFPAAQKTWLIDLAENVATELQHNEDSHTYRHLARCCTPFGTSILVGSWKSAKILELDVDTYTNDGEMIVRKLITQLLMIDSYSIVLNRLQVDFDNAVVDQSGQGSDPAVVLRWSSDGGYTYGNAMIRYTGKVGNYLRRTLWNRLGQTRQGVFELTMTDPVRWVILGGFLEYEVCSE